MADGTTMVLAANDDAERRERWLADRRTAITATDAAKVLGLSKWGSAIDVFLDKRGESVARPASAPMEWGNRLQQPILIAYADAVGQGIQFADPYAFLRSAETATIGASLDAIRVDDGRPVDAKNTRYLSAEWGESGTDRMPIYYATQLYIQMYVTGATRADLAVLFSGQELRIYTIERDEDVVAGIVDRCATFWRNHIETGIAPDPTTWAELDASSSTYGAYLATKFRQATDVIIPATADLEAAAAELRRVKARIAEAETDAARLENILKTAIGDAKGIAGAGFRALWTQAKDSVTIDAKGALAALPAALDAVVEDATIRRTIRETIERVQGDATSQKPASRRFTFTAKGNE